MCAMLELTRHRQTTETKRKKQFNISVSPACTGPNTEMLLLGISEAQSFVYSPNRKRDDLECTNSLVSLLPRWAMTTCIEIKRKTLIYDSATTRQSYATEEYIKYVHIWWMWEPKARKIAMRVHELKGQMDGENRERNDEQSIYVSGR